MTLVDILRMNSGDDDSSYANNSGLQKTVIQKVAPILKHTIKGMANKGVLFQDCFTIADLGCSSGMNTLSVVSDIINTIHEVCQENNRRTPQFQVCLNDLFGNDFNNLFKLLPKFYNTIKKDKGENFGQCFVSAVPGSFYDRLFPYESVHLVHSSYSIHWLSQVPIGIEDNRLNIYMGKTSPLNVLQAYENQFHTDFSNFLQQRSKEIVCGGKMVLTLRCRRNLDPTKDDSNSLWELLTKSLLEMLEEELVQESCINSFNIPLYFPHEDELKSIILKDGSFSLDNMKTFEFSWGQHDDTDYINTNEFIDDPNHNQGKITAKLIRAITEPLFASHFGKSINEVLFKKYEKNVAEHLAITRTRNASIVVSLTKK